MVTTPSVSIRDMLVLAGLGLVAFLPFLDAAPLFDWDEINFAESAREMLVTGNYFQVQINYEPFWEKPPLFFWLQVLSMKLFGVGDFAARFPNAIIGVFTLLSLYIYGTRLQGQQFGRILAGFYFVSILPFIYFKSGIIDPTFNYFIFLSLIHIIKYEVYQASGGNERARKMAPWIAGYWAGMATLTKGPVAVLVIFLVYLVYKIAFSRRHLPWLAMGKFVLLYLLVILSWFGSIVWLTEDGWELVEKFIVYQAELFSQPVAGHEQPFWYHFVVFVVGCFPLSAFAFRGMFTKPNNHAGISLKRFMLVWFWVVLLLFTIVKTKIVHYSSLTYFPGAFLAAFCLEEMIREKKKLKWDQYALLGLGTLVFGVAMAGINILTGRLEEIRAGIDDPFTKANLAADAGWTGYEFIPATLFTIAAIAAIVFLARKRYRRAMIIFVVATPIYLNGLNALVIPKIAQYTQMAAVDFFQEHSDNSCYLMVEGYKSYAHYYYGRVEPFPYPEIPRDKRGDWMARGKIDRPVYLVTRLDRVTEEFTDIWFPNFREIYRKNGFVFYLRPSGLSPTSRGPV